MKMTNVIKRLAPATIGLFAGIVLLTGPAATHHSGHDAIQVGVDVHVAVPDDGDIDWP